jgi:hypothetical protein
MGISGVAPTSITVPESVRSDLEGDAITAGGAPLPFGRRAARIASFSENTWQAESTKRPTHDSGYVSLDGDDARGWWAVGYRRDSSSLAPLVASVGAGGWKRVRTPLARRGGSTLTDVAVASRRSVWVVGYRLGQPGQRKLLAMHWNGRSWSIANPRLGSTERGMLAGVSSSPASGTWISGSVVRSGLEHPYVARRADGEWQRAELPAVGGGALSAISMDADGSGWAVGYQLAMGAPGPLLLHWDGAVWTEVDPAIKTEGDTLLLDVALDDDGVVTAAGSTWSAARQRMGGLVLRLEGEDWTTHTLHEGRAHLAFTGVDGDPSTDGWISGRGLNTGLLARTCDPSSDDTNPRSVSADVPKTPSVEIAATAGPTTEVTVTPTASLDGSIEMRDVTREVGLPSRSATWGATIADFDDDGRDDIFLGRHGGPARLYVAGAEGFTQSEMRFGGGDRHACVASDVDDSGLPDLFCDFGGGRGLGVKANQLWLDPGGPDPVLHPLAGGMVEPLGRGRRVALIDADADGDDDLFVGQEPNRADGLPSPSRLYLREGPALFVAQKRSGIAAGIGAEGLDVADIDNDGREDLLLLYEDTRAAGASHGLKLYRNTEAGFVDVARRYGIRMIGERDAALPDLDGDGQPDLVQLADDRIRISLQRDGRFRSVYRRPISAAVAFATGDADGDGDLDIYVLRQKDKRSTRDLVLFNRGDGRSYRIARAPSRRGGQADDVFPIDHDQNGLTDFLALNGRGSGRGPVQLIAFYR